MGIIPKPDMGDLSCIMPVVHPYAGGAIGKSHGNNYEIKDPLFACVGSAKLRLAMLEILLSNGALRAERIVKEHQAPFASKEEFLAFQDSLSISGERIVYDENEAKITI